MRPRQAVLRCARNGHGARRDRRVVQFMQGHGRLVAVQQARILWYVPRERIDDDVVPSQRLVRSLRDAVMRDGNNIYGPLIRLCNTHGYFMKQKSMNTDYNIVLTPIMMTSKEFVADYVRNFVLYKSFLAQTHGNGEDLSINHFLKYKYGNRPTQILGKFEYLDTITNSYSLKPLHKKQRALFCKIYKF